MNFCFAFFLFLKKNYIIFKPREGPVKNYFIQRPAEDGLGGPLALPSDSPPSGSSGGASSAWYPRVPGVAGRASPSRRGQLLLGR